MNGEPGEVKYRAEGERYAREGIVKRASFVVRIYLAASSPGSSTHWYGLVEHVQSLDHLAFQDLGNLIKFLETHAGIPSSAPQAWERPPPGQVRRLFARVRDLFRMRA